MLGITFRLTKDGLTTEKPNNKKLGLHVKCKNRFDGINACRKSYDFGYRSGLNPFVCLSQQMAIYDEFQEEALSCLLSSFSKRLKIKKPELNHPSVDEEYIKFELVVSLILANIKTSIRRWFKNNHFSEKTPLEQTDYTRKKRDLIIQSSLSSFDRWWDSKILTKQELEEAFNNNIDEWQTRIEDLFNKTFDIARTSSQIKIAEQESFCQFMVDSFGESVKIVDDTSLI